MKFKKESLELLRGSIDLVDVLSAYVQFSRSGTSFKALCPFHDEKTPSFIVQRGDSHYHCYGCGAHGDAITFLMTQQKLSFLDAIEQLADRFNVRLETIETEKGTSKGVLRDVMQKAADFYHFSLLHTEEGHEALNYLYKRGMDLEFIKTFKIGLAPKLPSSFQRYMFSLGISRRLLEEAGLIKNVNEKVFDFFSDRIAIALRDAMGFVVGFSARKFKDSTFGPKYINSPETLLFKKSKMLFGLSLCRKRIAKERRAIIVEGQFDALRLIYNGFNLTVAGQGTAFGENQVEELLNLGVTKVYLALDGDTAGQEAAVKIGQLFQKEGVEVLRVPLGEGEDPDSLCMEEGAEFFAKLLKESVSFVEFLVSKFSKTFDISTPSGKSDLVRTVTALIRDWNQPVLVHESLKKLAHMLNLPEELIGNEPAPSNIYLKKPALESTAIDGDKMMEMDLVRWLIFPSDDVKRFLEIAGKNLKDEYFSNKSLLQLYKKSFDNSQKDLLGLAQDLDGEEDKLISEMMQKRVNYEKREQFFTSSLQKILDRAWMREREEIRQKIQSGKLSDEEVLELIKKFDTIKNSRPEIIV